MESPVNNPDEFVGDYNNLLNFVSALEQGAMSDGENVPLYGEIKYAEGSQYEPLIVNPDPIVIDKLQHLVDLFETEEYKAEINRMLPPGAQKNFENVIIRAKLYLAAFKK